MRGPPSTGVIMVAALAMFGAPAAAARDSGGDEPSSSLIEQATRAASRSLGAAAPVAILRAQDRGYDVLQVIEAVLAERLDVDGSINDEDGAPVAPFRAAAGQIEGDPSSDATSGEAVGLAALERGVDRTTARLDKRVGLEARAERVGASEPSILTGLATIALLNDGYSPEQIIVDGVMGRGITVRNPVDGPVIVDGRGKVQKPDGVEESPEHEESAAAIDSFVTDVVDLIGGVDPHTAATEPFRAQFEVKIDVQIDGADGASYSIVGKGRIGTPADKSLRTFAIGKGDGELVGTGACSIGSGEKHPYEVSGDLVLGMSGPRKDGTVDLRIGVTKANLATEGDESGCVDIVRETSDAIELVTYGPIEVELRDGATASATSPFFDATATTTVKVVSA